VEEHPKQRREKANETSHQPEQRQRVLLKRKPSSQKIEPTSLVQLVRKRV
jgi:hypothetical protein